MKQLKKLPIGVQDFEKLITRNNVYVDKTEYLYKLINSGNYYFLARPRRFGKSLMLSTLKAYFLGEKKLFKNLKIAKLEKKWEKHPVFYIDFIDISKQGRVDKNLATRLDQLLAIFEKKWGTDAIRSKDYSFRFDRVIQSAVRKTGKEVVILVDEYDKPLLESMDDPDSNQKVKDILKSFYSIFKKNDTYMHFVMLTGVTKFSGLSIFSDLNNLEDITFDDQFSALCGITEKELLTNFDSELKNIAKNKKYSFKEVLSKMHELYNGYRFSPNGKSVFNPFSLLNCLKSSEFKRYWFRTGTPTFLIEEIQRTESSAYNLISNTKTTEDSLSNYRPDNRNIIPLLYQTGYLTIKSVENEEYLLGFPNKEVEDGFFHSLLDYVFPNGIYKTEFFLKNFTKDLIDLNIDAFMERLKSYFANFSYTNKPKFEFYYRDILVALIRLMGLEVLAESHSSQGRADIVVKAPKAIYLFEIKISSSNSKTVLLKAFNQIGKTGYLNPYTMEKKKIVKIAAIFSTRTKTLGSWKYKVV